MKLGLAIGTTLMAATLVVPGAFAQTTTRRIITNGESPYLGIGVKDVDSDSAKKLNLREVRGVEITQVEENSPAAKAGLKEGDVVLEFNGQRVEGGEQLSRFVRETPVGREIKLGVWRNGGMQTLAATVERHRGVMIANGRAFAMPEIPMPNGADWFKMPEMNMPGFAMTYNSPRIGIVGESLGSDSQLADFFGVKDGVLVKSVTKNSAAEKAGIKAGDVIVKVEDTKVEKAGDISAALRAAGTKKQLTVTVVRAKKEMTVTIESPAPMGTPVRAGMVVGPGWIQVGGTHVGWGPIVISPRARVVYQ